MCTFCCIILLLFILRISLHLVVLVWYCTFCICLFNFVTSWILFTKESSNSAPPRRTQGVSCCHIISFNIIGPLQDLARTPSFLPYNRSKAMYANLVHLRLSYCTDCCSRLCRSQSSLTITLQYHFVGHIKPFKHQNCYIYIVFV